MQSGNVRFDEVGYKSDSQMLAGMRMLAVIEKQQRRQQIETKK